MWRLVFLRALRNSATANQFVSCPFSLRFGVIVLDIQYQKGMLVSRASNSQDHVYRGSLPTISLTKLTKLPTYSRNWTSYETGVGPNLW